MNIELAQQKSTDCPFFLLFLWVYAHLVVL